MEHTDFQDLSPAVHNHARKPRNNIPLKDFNGHARITGPCGDTMEFWLLVQNNKIKRVSFITDGCDFSLACGSIATCLSEGMRVIDAAGFKQNDILEVLGGLPGEVEHCALLAVDTLKAACEDYFSHIELDVQGEPLSDKSACGTCSDTDCSATRRKQDESEAEFEENQKIRSRLCRIRHKIIVLSGKGGVGKSMVAVNIAVALAMSGKRVGLLDVDLHGPSIPTMLGLEREAVQGNEGEMIPVDVGGLKVLSLGFFLRNQDEAVIWRGPMKMGAIKQFIKDVAWGDLDYLIIDSPPGTGDEPLSVCQLIGDLDGAVIVTTPQKVAAVDVRKSITFCRQVHVPVLGVIENMSGFTCPKCGEVTHILRSGGGRRMAEDMGVPFLGSIPIDPEIARACDSGQPFVSHYSSSPTAGIMRDIIKPIAALDKENEKKETTKTQQNKENEHMRIAIPLADGKLTLHFGHCERFALIDVDTEAKKILKREDIEAPPHEPGLLPKWLAERGANVIIAGGMGQRAQNLFAEQGIQVMVGAPAQVPEQLVTEYLTGTLETGENACDH